MGKQGRSRGLNNGDEQEQNRARQVLDAALPSTRASWPATAEEFQQQLVDADLLREIKRHDVRPVTPQRRKRVDIQGTPLSETVMLLLCPLLC